MSWRDPRSWPRWRAVPGSMLLASVPLLLTACGFQPLYGERQGAPAVALKSIEIATIPDRQGQILRNQLELLLNPSGTPAQNSYRLSVSLATSGAEALIRQDETATRLDQTVTADYALTSLQDQRVVTRGRARSVNSFDVVESDHATLNAERDALEGNLRRIAHSIQTQLAVFFERDAAGLAPSPAAAPAAPERRPWNPHQGRIPLP